MSIRDGLPSDRVEKSVVVIEYRRQGQITFHVCTIIIIMIIIFGWYLK